MFGFGTGKGPNHPSRGTRKRLPQNDLTAEESQRYAAAVESYVTGKLSNLDGFVLFDTNNRYEIEFPSGWEKPAKESPSADKK